MASTRIADLNVRISAGSDDFRRGIEGAKRGIEKLKNEARGASDQFARLGFKRPFADLSAGAKKGAAAVRLNSAALQNMQFQMQDIAIGLASGQSPFRVMAQQGSQIVQIFGPGTGVQAALKQVGLGIATFIANPLNIALIAITAATAGIGFLTKGLFNSASAMAAAKDAAKELDAALNAAGGKTRDLARDTDSLTVAQSQLRDAVLAIKIDTLEKNLDRARRALAKQIPVDAFGRLGDAANKARDELVAAFTDGKIGAADLFSELRRLGFAGAPLNSLAAAADDVETLAAALESARGQATFLQRALARGAGKAPGEDGAPGEIKIPGTPRLKSDVVAEVFKNALDPIIAATRTPLEKLENALQDAVDLKKKFAAQLAEDPLALQAVDRQIEDLKDAIDNLKKKTSEWARISRQAGEGIADAFAGAIVFGERLDKTLARLA